MGCRRVNDGDDDVDVETMKKIGVGEMMML